MISGLYGLAIGWGIVLTLIALVWFVIRYEYTALAAIAVATLSIIFFGIGILIGG